ncbi:SIR2 family protein [Parabacteroides goldsteinii]|uniref:SIR2 family protein n=1 Tax=Parabacteroides goldsteinii TaxID=328812 RepID=UPI00101D50F2|nr:SIR2 family protein [Parabacteroides goldsteinii]
MGQDRDFDKKYILIRRDRTISYDDSECYINGIPFPKQEGDKRTTKQIAEQEKKKFNDLFFKKHYQNVVVLTAAGTSMDNGKCSGKTREGLWEHCKMEIDSFKDPIADLEEKDFYMSKNIEDLLSYLILYQKVNGLNQVFDNKIKVLEKKIAGACMLELQNEAPHKTFLNKVTARKSSDSRIQLFTTNYDTLFEQAANSAGFVVIDGFSFQQPREFAGRHFDYDIVNRERTRLKQEDSFISKVFHLYKLHGSLNWTKNTSGKIIQSSDTEKPMVIYPASEKYESSYEQPYFEMMSRFQQALRKDNVLLIVIGFGFQDKHIQNVILEAVEQNPSFQLVVVNYNGNANIDRYSLKDLFIDDKQEVVKRNVSIFFDTFRSFTDNYPENKTYIEDESL